MEQSDGFLSTRQIAELLQCSPSNVKRLAQLGRITPIGYVGGRRVWRRESVEEVRQERNARANQARIKAAT